MDTADLIGHIGSLLSSITFIPQVVQTWRSRSAADLNIWMLLIVWISTMIWIVYGTMKGLLPVILCNSIICLLSVLLIFFKFRFGGHSRTN